MKKLKGVCKDCLYGCNRLELETFEGVDECKYQTLEQVKLDLDKEKANE